MMLRTRQKEFVAKSVDALREYGDTLAIAATGFGKTIALSAVNGEIVKGKAGPVKHGRSLILQHRDNLVEQNRTKFAKVNPGIETSVYDGSVKNFAGRVVFAMEPTLRRERNLDNMPPVDSVTIDEAHHAAAPGYRRIIEKARELNEHVRFFGVTATANRGDRAALSHVFTNVADQVNIDELIESGHLVRPRCFVLDVGISKELKAVRRTASDFDMAQVEEIMDREIVTEKVIAHWREKAGDRRTIVFCSTIDHAVHVAEAFRAAGVSCFCMHSRMHDTQRQEVLDAYQRGDIQVLVNVAILTEGFDDQTTSCVVLLRPCSYQGTLIQMVGRGLRTVDPALHPGVVKTDCIVLDFGRSLLTHGSLSQRPDLDPEKKDGEVAACPFCSAMISSRAKVCPECGATIIEDQDEELNGEGDAEREKLEDFGLVEIDILARSNFRWCDLFDDGMSLAATGFNAWAVVLACENGQCLAIGGGKGLAQKLLGVGDMRVCLALGDDHMNAYESEDAAHKSRKWLNMPATDRQLPMISGLVQFPQGMNRYHASCLITWKFNVRQIMKIVEGVMRG
jgi:DNA repair protein RadD